MEMLETIKTLGVILITLIPILTFFIQQLKESFGLSDKPAQIVSFVISGIVSVLVAVGWGLSESWDLSFYQWVGFGLFVLIGTLGPSGGYKLLGSFSGSRG